MKFQVFQDYPLNSRFSGQIMKIQVFLHKTHRDIPGFPGLIMKYQVFRTTRPTYEISGFSDQSWNSRFSGLIIKFQVCWTHHDILGSSGLNMKFQVFQDKYLWNVRFLGPKMKFPVFQKYPWNSRCPLLIMKLHVFPDKSWNSEFSRTRVRVRREGLVTRAEDRCCVECPSALIRCGGLNPTCRKPSGPEPLLSPHSAAPAFIVYRCSGHDVLYLLDR